MGDAIADKIFGKEPSDNFDIVLELNGKHPAAYKDEIDVYYYITKGRPLEAYTLFCEKGEAAFTGNGYVRTNGFEIDTACKSPWKNLGREIRRNNKLRNSIVSELSEEEITYIVWYIRVATFTNIDDPIISASAIVFLEFCGIDSKQLRVDNLSLKRTRDYITAHKEAGIQDSLINLYLSFPIFGEVSTNSDVQQALSLLEQSTKAIEEPVLQDINLQKTISKWSLVTQFCRAHNLQLSSGHLRELAEKNDWVSFLYEAESQGFGVHQLLKIVEKYFLDASLKEHLGLVLANVMRSSIFSDPNEPNDWGTVLLGNISQLDMLHIILNARKSKFPSKVTFLVCLLKAGTFVSSN